MSVIDNVMVAFPRQTGENLLLDLLLHRKVIIEERRNAEKAMVYLDMVEIADKAFELAGDISAAEQKLLALARLLATECPLLLLDEPTSGLDPDSVRKVGNVVQEIVTRGGKTVFLVEHNLDVIRELAEIVYFMDMGQIVACGSPAELMADRKLAEVYFGESGVAQ
jgi:ABC-type branched-subunit amino acid transport system ATPase component